MDEYLVREKFRWCALEETEWIKMSARSFGEARWNRKRLMIMTVTVMMVMVLMMVIHGW